MTTKPLKSFAAGGVGAAILTSLRARWRDEIERAMASLRQAEWGRRMGRGIGLTACVATWVV